MEKCYVKETNKLNALGEKIFLDRYALKDDKGNLVEHTVEEMQSRVAKGAAEGDKAGTEEEFRWVLEGWRFVPGGRILTGCGTSQKLTYFNCYVIPSPKDSREGVIETLGTMVEIMSRGGGVGVNLSSLRPRHSYVKGVNGRSSGSVSWGGLLSFATGLVEQGGSRRGALMLMLDVWHPDVLEFIDAKREAGKITNANISVNVSDNFMKAVKDNDDWSLVFPDTTSPEYETWTGDLDTYTGPVKTYATVKAREIWDKICQSAWASAEPGVFFGGAAKKESNSWSYPEGTLRCTNPCGEQPLPAYSVCNLGHINLARFATKESFLWGDLEHAVKLAVRFLDNIIDRTPYFLPQNEKQQKLERRIGLGTMGLAELLIRLGFRYGSSESLVFIDELYGRIKVWAYESSASLAAERGKCPAYTEALLESGFVQRLPEDTIALIRKQGLRNITLLTQAPTGTVGTMVGTSTGIEPYFAWEYIRKTRLGTHTEYASVVEDWRAEHGDEPLPEEFVTAMELEPEDHVRVQAAIQRHVDSAISKTCNLPSDYTVDQVKHIYEMMYESGCKGGTVYRDKSRDEQVLNLSNPEPTEATSDPAFAARPSLRYGATATRETAQGTCHITVNWYSDDPCEVYIEVGKAGSETKTMAEGLGRMISMLLRVNSPVSREERIKEIVRQLHGIGGARYGYKAQVVSTIPEAVAQVLEEVCLGARPVQPMVAKVGEKQHDDGPKNTPSSKCPACGNNTLLKVEGCQKCLSCGYSKC